jgi:hypothetical protein
MAMPFVLTVLAPSGLHFALRSDTCSRRPAICRLASWSETERPKAQIKFDKKLQICRPC